MNAVPSIFFFSSSAGVLAIIGFVVVQRLLKSHDLQQHQDFLDGMLGIGGTLISILLGLSVASALDSYRGLEQNVDKEAAAVAQVFRLSGGLPSASRTTFRELCADYCKNVINDEWPAMAAGKSSRKLAVTYAELVQSAVRFTPHNDRENNIHSALLTAIQEMGDCRRERLLALTSAWKKHLMPVLLMCSVIVLLFSFLFGRRGVILHGVVIWLVAIALGANLGLIFVLSNPFAGEWRIQPTAFLLNLQLLRELQTAPELQKYLQDEVTNNEATSVPKPAADTSNALSGPTSHTSGPNR